MQQSAAFVEFVHLPSYVRSTKHTLDEEQQRQIELAICRNPNAGTVIRETGGLRKLRVALKGRGKSGGGRVIYFNRSVVGRVYLVLFYSKNVQANLSKAQKQQMRNLTATLRAEK